MRDKEMLRDKVPMTKEGVRFMALGLLGLYRAKRFLDVGTGTGSVAVTAKVWHPHLEVVAVERKAEALALSRANAHKQSIAIDFIEGVAPLEIIGTFDAIFVGGTGGQVAQLLPWLEKIANPGCTVVMTFVTIEQFTQTLHQLKTQMPNTEVEIFNLQVQVAMPLGPFTHFSPQNPTWIVHFIF